MSLNGSAHEGRYTSDVEQLEREVQRLRESQASTMEATRNMLVEFTRNNGPSESRNAEGGAAVGESARGAIPTVVRKSSRVEGNAAADVGESARGAIPTVVRPTSGPAGERLVPDARAGREAILSDRGISAQWDSEKPLFPLRLVRRGVSLTSQGGLARGVHSPAVS